MSSTTTKAPASYVEPPSGSTEAPNHTEASPAAHASAIDHIDALPASLAGQSAAPIEDLSGVEKSSVIADRPTEHQIGVPSVEMQPLASTTNSEDRPVQAPSITFTNPDGVSIQVSSPLPASSVVSLANTPITSPAALPVGLPPVLPTVPCPAPPVALPAGSPLVPPTLLPAASMVTTPQVPLAESGSLQVPSASGAKAKKLGNRMRPTNSLTPRHVTL